MDQIYIESTKSSPEISLNPTGTLRFKGRSIHENAQDFFESVISWVGKYINDPADTTFVDIQLEYFNSATAKYIIVMLQKLKEVRLKDKKYYVNWFYEEGDEDILERGEYFASVLDMEFNFVEIS
ncbi:MAG TPA: nuclear pore complex subunit [Bacteroidales bacterium]|nr:nuclear pore complex subunit [Bacteroidales bacterium]